MRGADLEGRNNQLLHERIRSHLSRRLDQVTRHLRCGRDGRVEEAPAAGCPDGPGQDARGHGVAALDSGRSQHYLPHTSARGV
jgi:hypothetical protein